MDGTKIRFERWKTPCNSSREMPDGILQEDFDRLIIRKSPYILSHKLPHLSTPVFSPSESFPVATVPFGLHSALDSTLLCKVRFVLVTSRNMSLTTV